jgi:hypothetical protein
MDGYLAQIEQERLCGINAKFWRMFFKEVEAKKVDQAKLEAIQRLASQMGAEPEEVSELVDRIIRAIGLLGA